eukprot:5556476-Prymnesium_polylepis.1
MCALYVHHLWKPSVRPSLCALCVYTTLWKPSATPSRVGATKHGRHRLRVPPLLCQVLPAPRPRQHVRAGGGGRLECAAAGARAPTLTVQCVVALAVCRVVHSQCVA